MLRVVNGGGEEGGDYSTCIMYIVASVAVPKYNLFLIIELMAWMSPKHSETSPAYRAHDIYLYRDL
jgi:hypothetical protein